MRAVVEPDPALAAGLEAIATRGFTIAREVISKSEIPELKEALAQAIAEDLEAWTGREYANAHMAMNLMMRGAPFVRLLENPAIHSFLTPLLGETCILYAYTSSSMPPGGTNYSRRIHVDSPRMIPGYVTNVGITLALDDFTQDNGAMSLLPGSFGLAEAPDEAQFDRSAELVLPRAGDAIIFNARTWHRGGVNNSERYRHAVTMNACRSYMRQQFDYPRMVSDDMLAQVGECGRRFLGFNVRMPCSLDEYYLPPELRPYKPNQG